MIAGKIFRSVLALATLAMLNGCASLKTTVQPSWQAHKSHRVAVLPFKGDFMFGENLSDFLVTELVDRGFTVIERSELGKVIQEHGLQYTGAVDPQTLTRSGQLAGVDFIIIGSVSTREVVPVGEWLIGAGNAVTQVDSVHVRWVSVRNGEIVASSRFRNSRGGKMSSIAAKIAESMGGAIETMSVQAAARANEAPAEGRQYAGFTFSN